MPTWAVREGLCLSGEEELEPTHEMVTDGGECPTPAG
jgi:hypothetical protein